MDATILKASRKVNLVVNREDGVVPSFIQTSAAAGQNDAVSIGNDLLITYSHYPPIPTFNDEDILGQTSAVDR